MLTAGQVADYFLLQVDEDAGDAMTHLRLQKLVYYAQAWHLVLARTPLIAEDFEAWAHGPVAPSLYRDYRDCGWQSIPRPNRPIAAISPWTQEILGRVWDVYGRYSATGLEALTHHERPWLEARRGCIPHEPCQATITKVAIREFYANNMPIDPAYAPFAALHATRNHGEARARDESYRAHLQVAHRFHTAPIDSDERALAGVELSARLAADRGESYQAQGGDARAVIARLRRQQNAVRETGGA